MYSKMIENRFQQIEATLKDLVECGIKQTSQLENQQSQGQASEFGSEGVFLSTLRDHAEVTLDATGRFDIDKHGLCKFYGHSSGLAFLAQIQQKYGQLLGCGDDSNTRTNTGLELPSIFDSRPLLRNPSHHIRPNLPPRAVAEDLVDAALENICLLSRVVHRPTFDIMFDQVYDLGHGKWGLEEVQFLPLLCAVMAVGSFASCRDGNKHSDAASTA